MKIIINERTPTVNRLYSRGKWNDRVFMSAEAKVLKARIIRTTIEQAKQQNYHQPEWAKRLLKVRVTIYENWWTKKHTVWKKDIANREKFLIDAIMDGLGLDDSAIWEHIMLKKDSKEDKAVIEIDWWRDTETLSAQKASGVDKENHRSDFRNVSTRVSEFTSNPKPIRYLKPFDKGMNYTNIYITPTIPINESGGDIQIKPMKSLNCNQ